MNGPWKDLLFPWGRGPLKFRTNRWSGQVAEVWEKERISDNCALGAHCCFGCVLYEEIYRHYYGGGKNHYLSRQGCLHPSLRFKIEVLAWSGIKKGNKPDGTAAKFREFKMVLFECS